MGGYKSKKAVEQVPDFERAEGLWQKSECRSDFYGLLAYYAPDVRCVDKIKKVYETAHHPSELKYTWMPRREVERSLDEL